ncbi:hypothetical protein [Aquariibacter albus]|uniref:Uncharacterized protein n=1 Tax=Aquariibacter albus TaxID=2759899 RepID=A0A839HG69_9BURK|nr:hypothetical protein [Aquariibacter albus]MBB1160553.1 hypothetical protein [Aquariibacter albus]
MLSVATHLPAQANRGPGLRMGHQHKAEAFTAREREMACHVRSGDGDTTPLQGVRSTEKVQLGICRTPSGDDQRSFESVGLIDPELAAALATAQLDVVHLRIDP